MPWRNHTEINEDNTVHVWPENDLPDHLTEPGDPPCWCEPELTEYDNGNVQVLHRDLLDRLRLLDE